MNLRRYCAWSGHIAFQGAGDKCSFCERAIEDADDPILTAVIYESGGALMHQPLPEFAYGLCWAWCMHPRGVGGLANGGVHCAKRVGHDGACAGDEEIESRTRRIMERR